MDKPLTKLTDAELDELLVRETSATGRWGYLQVVLEIARRDSRRRELRMLWMTAAIVVLTLVNAALVAYTIR